eukprot:COSAG02_NODE_202_length_29305_cov_20.432377_22_plen_655_part_00
MQVVPAQVVPSVEAHAGATGDLENSPTVIEGSAATVDSLEDSLPTVIEGSVHTAEDDDVAARFGAAGAAVLQRAAALLQSGELLKVRELLTPIADRVARDPADDSTHAQHEGLRAEALAGLAQCMRREGACSENALARQFELFDLACRMRPEVAAYHAASADILHKRGRLREAAEHLQGALNAMTAVPRDMPSWAASQSGSSVILFAEDVADTRRWRVQLQLVQSQLKSASEAAERELLAGLEEEAKMEAEEATRRQHKRAQRAAKKKQKADSKHYRTTNQSEPEPEPEPEQWPPPEDDVNGDPAGHSVLRPLSGSDAADTSDGTPFTMVMAVPSAQQPLLTVTATAAVSGGAESSTAPDGVTAEGSTAQDTLDAVPDTQRIGSDLAAPAVRAEGLEEVEGEEIDDAAGVGLGLKDSFGSASRAEQEEQQAEFERMLAEKAATVASMDLADADAAFAAAADDARVSLNQELQRLSNTGAVGEGDTHSAQDRRHQEHLVAADLDEAAVREAMVAVYAEQEELLARAAGADRTRSTTNVCPPAGPDTVEMNQRLLMGMATAFEERLEVIVSGFERRVASASASAAASATSATLQSTGHHENDQATATRAPVEGSGSAPIAEIVRAIATELELGEYALHPYWHPSVLTDRLERTTLS